MILYTGSLDDRDQLVQFIRRETANMRSLRKLIVSREKTVVRDVNGDEMEFPGLSYARPMLDVLLGELGVVGGARTWRGRGATAKGLKELRRRARHPWGHERGM